MFDIVRGTIDELYPFIISHYTKSQYILNYTKSHLQWDLTNGESEILLLKLDTEIIGSITGKFQNCMIDGSSKKIVIVNFLCIREDYRRSNLHKYLIKFLEKISHSRGAELGIYISSDVHSAYTCKVSYYFIKDFPERTNDNITISTDEMVDEFIIQSLTRYYHSKSRLHPIFTPNFFNDGINRGILKTFTIRKGNEIIHFISYYLLDCVNTETKITTKQAYILYYFTEDISIFKETFKELNVDTIILNDIMDFSELSNRKLLQSNFKSMNEIYYYIRDTSVSGSVIIPNNFVGMFVP